MGRYIHFDAINFNPDTKELTILSNGTVILGPFDLSAVAVKLKVVRIGEQLEVLTETGNPNNFPADNLELKIKFSGDGHCANLLFGTLNTDCFSSIDTSELIGTKDDFHALWIGADDIRNTRTATKGLLLMEREITSFAIVDDNLVMKYHDA